MSYRVETDSFINDLNRVTQVRSEVSTCLNQIAETLERAEVEGKKTSGGLGLEAEIEDINAVSKNLRKRENLRDWLIDRGIKTVVFVVNFLNLLESEDQKQVYNRLLFVAESFRAELPPGISNLYRVDALPALRARLKGDVSAAHSTGLAMFESALQNIVTVQQEKLATRIPRVLAISTQLKQALQAKAEAIVTELASAEKIISFRFTEAPFEMKKQQHQLELLNNSLENLAQELQLISGSLR